MQMTLTRDEDAPRLDWPGRTCELCGHAAYALPWMLETTEVGNDLPFSLWAVLGSIQLLKICDECVEPTSGTAPPTLVANLRQRAEEHAAWARSMADWIRDNPVSMPELAVVPSAESDKPEFDPELDFLCD